MTLAAKHRTLKALREVKRGKSVASAAKNNDVERTYLRRRIEGIPTRQLSDEA